MFFSGNNFKLVPNVTSFSYELNGISMSNPSGMVDIGFSGTNQALMYSFRSGKVYDFNGRYFRAMSSGDFFSISGDIIGGLHRYYSDGILVGQNLKNNFIIQKFVVNTTGCGIYTNVKLLADINVDNYGIEIQPQFFAGDYVTGRIFNNSPETMRVFSSHFSYQQIDNADFSGNMTGDVGSYSELPFTLLDKNSSRADTNVGLTVKLETSIGKIQQTLSIQRKSNLTGDIRQFRTDNFNTSNIYTPLSGSGLDNKFLYILPASGLKIQTIDYRRFDNAGISKNKTITLHIQPDFPTGIELSTGTFITGFSVSNSGFYSEAPSAVFREYSAASGVEFTAGNLFSLGCGPVIPFTLDAKSGDGVGGTGKAYLRQINIGLYGSSKFYTITGMTIENGGSGYNYAPVLNLMTGSLGSQCFDVPRISGAAYVYYPCTGTGLLAKQAGYLYAELLTGVRVTGISGSNFTGFGVVGIKFANIGSGYNTASGFNPVITIIRSATDAYSAISEASGFNSSGAFNFNTSGDAYSFTGNWSFKTGSSFNNLAVVDKSSYYYVTGYSGTISLSTTENELYIYSYFKQNTNDTGVSIKITARTDDPGYYKSVYISGINTSSTYSGMLKLPSSIINTGIFIYF